MDSGSTKIVFDCECFRLYKDGRVERVVGTEDTVPAGFDADTGVTSKDVVIDATNGVAARLFLPSIEAVPAATKLPILIFFHGGYFVVGSPTHPWFHRYCNLLASSARALVVSVRYRLAPEHVLPAAYDDAWAALNWALSGADPWLSEHGDHSRVFVTGVSAGANIAHNVAIAAGVRGLHTTTPAPARIEGVILFHPSFASEQRMEAESEEFCQGNRIRWAAVFPGAKGGLDDPRINPMAAGAPSLAKLPGERLLVCTASEDPRAPRGRAYCDAVRASVWRGEVDWFESNGEEHGFFVPNPVCSEAIKLMGRVVAFVAG
ncbi:hypothetical protein PR202_gb22427 [Eleusine coracana subsp. coracana]|uniref:Alpha/beta hydrolase fold-3 domain-containing protein n=1 Tax=Eleusine coracana subsp. coracana TaxID=191504 RepID=A0AAV5FGJ5_ELECO|nr:hypothetical protein QOZ80_6AG0537450 [Eleusine coracana subsp. coracana]GJN33802.1 hypothetical protein PR202_gb22427 [Eleusine coracana subsp. coracana]